MPRRVHLAQFALITVMAIVLASCSDMLFSPNQSTRGVLALRPYFSMVNSEMLADINVIHITAKKLPSGPVVFDQDFTVDPNPSGGAWDLPIELEPNASYEITMELINRVGGVDNIVQSGVIPSISVTAGPQPTPAPVQTFPGPPDNLSVKSVTIAPRDQSLLEGDQVAIKANVDGPVTSVVLWNSSNPGVATVENGSLVAKLPGTAEITAIVGPKTDKITVTVGQKATQVELTPNAKTLLSFGEDATFSTRVLDVRNTVVPGLSASCTIQDATIATQISPCVFRGRKNGTTKITATATQAGRTLTSTSDLTVSQKAVSISVDPAEAGPFDALGGTQQFTAKAKDANGNEVTGLTFTWSSSDANVASVDNAGLATIKGNGTANIKVDVAGSSATAKLTVQQRPASISVTPDQRTFKSINETQTLKATVKDSRGNEMTTPIVWLSSIPGIASVDANGVVTAKDDGSAVITAQVGPLRAYTSIVVNRAVATVQLSESKVTLDAGNSKQLYATAADANGFAINDVSVTWATNNSAVATVTNAGLVTGLSAGTAEITAKAAGAFGVATFTVKGVLSGNLRVNSNGKVLLINADYSEGTNVKAQLVSTGLFTADKIDELQMSSSPPALSALSGYGAVLVWTNYSPSNPAGWGDLLKQYVDAGGKVVLAVYSYSNLSDPWDIEGGIMSAGYSPLVNNNTRYNEIPYSGMTLNFTTALTSHPILAGVSEFTYGGNSNYVKVTVAPGATLIARDANGVPLIGISASGAVIGFNLYPGTGSFPKSAGVWKAFANALK